MNDAKQFLRSIYQWREIFADKLDSFEEKLQPYCQEHITTKTLENKYQGKLHLAILRPVIFSKALFMSEPSKKQRGLAFSNDEEKCNGVIHLFCTKGGFFATEECPKEALLKIQTLQERGIIFLHHNHYCLPLEFLMHEKGEVNNASWFNMCKNLSSESIKKLLPKDVKKKMHRTSPLVSEMITRLYLLGREQQAAFKAHELNQQAWVFLLDLHLNEQGMNDSELSQVLNKKPKKNFYNLNDVIANTPSTWVYQLIHMGLIGIQLCADHNGYYYNKPKERLVLSEEGKRILKPYWDKQTKKMASILQEQWQVKEPTDYQHSIWENDHLLWRMSVTLQFIQMSLTQQDNWRVADIKKVRQILKDLDEDQVYQLIHTLITLGGKIEQNVLHLDSLSIKSITQKMKAFMFRQSGVDSSSLNMQLTSKILKTLPEGEWLDIEKVFVYLGISNAVNQNNVRWEAFFKPSPRSPFHFNEQESALYLLPHFKRWVQGKNMQLASPGWLGLKKGASSKGYISAAGDIQLPPETCASLYPDLATFCTLVSVEHMVHIELDQQAIKRLALKPKELAKAKASLERIQSPLPQAVSYLFERELNQKVMAVVTATSALVEIKESKALNQLNKIGQLSPCPNKKNAWLLSPSDSAALFIAKCRKQGLKVEGNQDEEEASSTAHAWVEGYYSIRTWVDTFQASKNGEWLEIVYQKRSADALKTCYAYYAETDHWYNHLNLQLVKSAKKGYTLMKRATKFEHQHLHKLRLLSDDEVKSLNIKGS